MSDIMSRSDLIAHIQALQSKAKDLYVQLFWDGVISIIRQFPAAEIIQDERRGQIMAGEEKNIVDAKAYLKQVELCDTRINNKLDELSVLKSIALKVTPSLSHAPAHSSGGQDKVGDVIAKIIDLEADINRTVDELVDKKREISAVVDQIQNADQLSVIYKHYFQFETLEQIACDMHMSYRNVCYIHGRALQRVAQILAGK